MAQITPQVETDIRDMVFGFFSEECGIDRATLKDSTHIINELGGDSLMFLMLLEKVRKRFGVAVPLDTLAKHLMRKPAGTIGQVVDLSVLVVRHDGNLAAL